MMWYWGYPYMMGGYWGWILPVLFWVVIIAVFASVLRGGRYGRWHHYHDHGQGGFSDRGRDPLDILKERYAKGDISEEQYARMRKEIEK